MEPLQFAWRPRISVIPRRSSLLRCCSSANKLAHTTSSRDLLIVGPGVLGRLVAQNWLKGNAGCKVVGQTNSTTHHDELKQLGIAPVVKDAQSSSDKFPYVVFCAPPSGSEDYPAEVRMAAERWNGEGSLLFTSSSAVYDCSNNGVCDESCPALQIGSSPRTDRLLKAEAGVLNVGGNVVRLAGLYTKERGAHTYWLGSGPSTLRPDHMVNLIHYEDAASLCFEILKGGFRGRVFMGCDGVPLSRQELMDATNNSGKFDTKFTGFTGSQGPLGKRMDNSKTRQELQWQPRFESFAAFICDKQVSKVC